MKSPIKKITELLSGLPERDILLSKRFLRERDLDSLKELVDSALIRVSKNLLSEVPKEEYLNLNMEILHTLKVEVDNYFFQNQIEDFENPFEEEMEDLEDINNSNNNNTD